MSLFGKSGKKSDAKPQQPGAKLSEKELFECSQKLGNLALAAVRDEAGGVRVEDAICVLSTIVAERCIDAAGDISLRNHNFAPGQRVVSDKVNRLLVGDPATIKADSLPADSVFGVLFRSVADSFPADAYPDLSQVFKGFSGETGDPAGWGKVPLSVPEANRPSVLPIRVAYETRGAVDQILARFRSNRGQALLASVVGLSLLLKTVKAAIEPKIALLLCAELINGMAQTAPMTGKAMANIVAHHARTAS